MHPNLTTFTNKGSVQIFLTVNESTDFIVIHIREMNITLIKFSDDIQIEKSLEYPKNDQLYLKFNSVLSPNQNYSLTLNFSKNLEEKLEGFYISSYLKNGKKRFLATTHFEPVSARSAFPCFDEPALKSTFELKMVHSPDYNVLFNSEQLDRIQYSNDKYLSVFDRTVKMSTYLVAFIVSDFKHVEDKTRSGVKVSTLLF